MVLQNIKDKKTLRGARLVSISWFKIFHSGKFEFYFTSKDDWKQMCKILSRYRTPMSISLKKNILQSFKTILKSITKLTTLVSFSMDVVHGKDFPSTKELLKLSVLSNLTELNIGMKLPKELKSVMPQLRMHLVYQDGPMDDLANCSSVALANSDRISISKLTALEHLSSEKAFYGLTSTNLTSLSLKSTNRAIEDIFNDQSNHLLTNLKSLELRMADSYCGCLQSLVLLTNLESLLIDTIAVSNAQLCKTFTKLKSFTLTGSPSLDYEEDLSFLSDLTNLETLNVRLINDSFRSISPLTNVTQLEIQSVVVYLGGVSIYRYPKLCEYFPNLETLTLDSAMGADIHGIIGLSKLTRLLLTQSTNPTDVSRLTQLREITIAEKQVALIKHWTNLECLRIKEIYNEDWEHQIEHMKNLTQLVFNGAGLTKINIASLPTKLQLLSGSIEPWKEKQTKDLLKALPNLYYVDIHPWRSDFT